MVMLSDNSVEASFYDWVIKDQDSSDEILNPPPTQERSFSYTFVEYGLFQFEVIAINEIGESEPFRIVIEVSEPIENFAISDINFESNTANSVATGETFTIDYGQTFGNNINYTIYYTANNEDFSFQTTDQNYQLIFNEAGEYFVEGRVIVVP